MIYLLLSVLISSSLFVVFKLFEVFKINTLQAIITNYAVAFLIGNLSSSANISINQIPQQSWFFGALFLGILFVSVFNLMAITAQKNGLSVASVASKMSVIIPVIFGFIVYQESIDFLKVFGILLSLVAVYLSSVKENATEHKQYFLYPILLFLGSGIIDASIKYFETTYVKNGELPIFSATIFGFAFLFGFLLFVFQLIKKGEKFQFKNIIGGIVLGIPNYYSIVFLLKALKTDGLESSTLFTINNVAIVLLTTVFGLLFFKERLIIKNWIGILIAVISIILVASS